MEPNPPPAPTKRQRYMRAALITLAAVVVVWGVMKITSSQKEVSLPVSAAATAQSAIVTVDGSGFEPNTLTIKRGATVTWQNVESDTYSQIVSDTSPTSTSAQLPDLNSSRLDSRSTYSYTFTKTGTFTYHDGENEMSGGKVIVVE